VLFKGENEAAPNLKWNNALVKKKIIIQREESHRCLGYHMDSANARSPRFFASIELVKRDIQWRVYDMCVQRSLS